MDGGEVYIFYSREYLNKGTYRVTGMRYQNSGKRVELLNNNSIEIP